MKYTRTILGVAASVLLTSALFSTAQAQPPPGYTLAFDEEFSGPLNVSPGYGWGPIPPAKWIAHTPYSGDFGDAWFSGPGEPNTANPFSVANGILTIQAFRDPLRPTSDQPAGHWRSGLLASVDPQGNGFAQALGYFECRMQMPAGYGTWPAFWLGDRTALPKATSTGNRAEIDVVEAYGADPTAAYQTVHDWTYKGVGLSGNQHLSRINGIESGFHTYACLIKSDFMHFYIDGVEQWKTPTFPDALHPLYPMVDLALYAGQSANVPNPARLLVDYVRVYAPPAP